VYGYREQAFIGVGGDRDWDEINACIVHLG
jgi:hypothetical protein